MEIKKAAAAVKDVIVIEDDPEPEAVSMHATHAMHLTDDEIMSDEMIDIAIDEALRNMPTMMRRDAIIEVMSTAAQALHALAPIAQGQALAPVHVGEGFTDARYTLIERELMLGMSAPVRESFLRLRHIRLLRMRFGMIST